MPVGDLQSLRGRNFTFSLFIYRTGVLLKFNKWNSNQPKTMPKGTYQPEAGQANCVNADAGYYVENFSSTLQTPCPGNYQPLRAS